MAVEGKRALALAVEGLVLGRGDDPVLPVEVLKAHPGWKYVEIFVTRPKRAIIVNNFSRILT